MATSSNPSLAVAMFLGKVIVPLLAVMALAFGCTRTSDDATTVKQSESPSYLVDAVDAVSLGNLDLDKASALETSWSSMDPERLKLELAHEIQSRFEFSAEVDTTVLEGALSGAGLIVSTVKFYGAVRELGRAETSEEMGRASLRIVKNLVSLIHYSVSAANVFAKIDNPCAHKVAQLVGSNFQMLRGFLTSPSVTTVLQRVRGVVTIAESIVLATDAFEEFHSRLMPALKQYSTQHDKVLALAVIVNEVNGLVIKLGQVSTRLADVLSSGNSAGQLMIRGVTLSYDVAAFVHAQNGFVSSSVMGRLRYVLVEGREREQAEYDSCVELSQAPAMKSFFDAVVDGRDARARTVIRVAECYVSLSERLGKQSYFQSDEDFIKSALAAGTLGRAVACHSNLDTERKRELVGDCTAEKTVVEKIFAY